jgi:hypothetical protein
MDDHIDFCIRHIIDNKLYLNSARTHNIKIMKFIVKDYTPIINNCLTIYLSARYHLMKYTNAIIIHDLADLTKIIYSTRLDKKTELYLWACLSSATPCLNLYLEQVMFEKYILNNRMYDNKSSRFNDSDCAAIISLLLANNSTILPNPASINKELTWEGEQNIILVFTDRIVISVTQQTYTFIRHNNLLESLLFHSDDRYRLIRPDIKVARYMIKTDLVTSMIRGISLTLIPSTNCPIY